MPNMSEGKINSNFNKTNPEKDLLKHEKISWEERIMNSRNKKTTLEYTEVVKEAKKLLKTFTPEQLEEMGEEEVMRLCSPDIIDVAVVVGAAYQLKQI